MKILAIIMIGGWLILMAHGQSKPLPQGLSLEGFQHSVGEVEFLADYTFQRDGKPVHEQAIFNRMCRIVEEAERFVLLDLFLFNSVHGQGDKFPALAEELTGRLVAKKQQVPGVDIVLITDVINRSYGAEEPAHFKKLRASGIRIIYTDTGMLRDSNFLYSAWWRIFCQWFGTQGEGWLPSPFGANGPAMTLRGYLSLLNFKANHRKVAANEKEALITSGNPHDASAYHSNIGFVVQGNVLQDIVDSEAAVANLSGETLPKWALPVSRKSGDLQVRLLTEGKIKSRLLQELARCNKGCSVRMAMFYLSDRDIVEGLLDAADRGAEVRLLLDPNKDAFGRSKNGIPNRPVASELVARSEGAIQVRWYETHGEQFHSKLTIISQPGHTVLIGGSANLTRRNIDDLNLETCLEVAGPAEAKVMREATGYFERLWRNRDGNYSIDFKEFFEDSPLRYWLYRFQEWSGMSTF